MHVLKFFMCCNKWSLRDMFAFSRFLSCTNFKGMVQRKKIVPCTLPSQACSNEEPYDFLFAHLVLDLFRYLWYRIVPLLLRMTKAHSISQNLYPCSCAHTILCSIHHKCKLGTRCLPPSFVFFSNSNRDWIVIRTSSSNIVFSTPQHDVTSAPTILFPRSFFL